MTSLLAYMNRRTYACTLRADMLANITGQNIQLTASYRGIRRTGEEVTHLLANILLDAMYLTAYVDKMWAVKTRFPNPRREQSDQNRT